MALKINRGMSGLRLSTKSLTRAVLPTPASPLRIKSGVLARAAPSFARVSVLSIFIFDPLKSISVEMGLRIAEECSVKASMPSRTPVSTLKKYCASSLFSVRDSCASM